MRFPTIYISADMDAFIAWMATRVFEMYPDAQIPCRLHSIKRRRCEIKIVDKVILEIDVLPLTATRTEINVAALNKDGGNLYAYLYDHANEAFNAGLKPIQGLDRIRRYHLLDAAEFDPNYQFSEVELNNTSLEDRERFLTRWRNNIAKAQERLPPIDKPVPVLLHETETLVTQQRESGPSEQTKMRFTVFKEIKSNNPTWTQEQVAMEAEAILEEYGLSAQDVKNAYRAMGEQWQRGKRTR